MHTRRIDFLRPLLAGLAAVGLLFAAGCATTSSPATLAKPPVDAGSADEPAPEPDLPLEVRGTYIGEIVRVNTADRYVVVRCRRLPSEGEEARVERGQWQKGRIRFTRPMQAPFATADILRGEMDPGDHVLR